jgi:hypothetical protein
MTSMPPTPESAAAAYMPPESWPNYDLIVLNPKTTELTAAAYMPPECWPNYDLIVTEDGKAVDGPYDEKQMRLLTSVLYDSWSGPGDNRVFMAAANVGLFYSFNEPPLVPDMMLSLDVRIDMLHQKKRKSYFVWEFGKPPDATVEIVSGTDGGELEHKLEIYQRIGVPYYVVWDPRRYLSDKTLHCFIKRGGKYEVNGTWLPELGLGVAIWTGTYETWDTTWLRWCDQAGIVIPTGSEKIEQETQRAEQEKQRAEKMAEKLRAMGIDPDQP